MDIAYVGLTFTSNTVELAKHSPVIGFDINSCCIVEVRADHDYPPLAASSDNEARKSTEFILEYVATPVLGPVVDWL